MCINVNTRANVASELQDVVKNKSRAQCGWDVHMTISKRLVEQNNRKPKSVHVRQGNQKEYVPCVG